MSPSLIFGAVALVLGTGLFVAALSLPHVFDGAVGVCASLLVALNGATFALYGYDKAIAGGRKLRVPESVLHVMAAAGGTIGAWIAQRLFRHKVSKPAFQRVFWLTALVQVALIAVAVVLLAHPGWLPGAPGSKAHTRSVASR